MLLTTAAGAEQYLGAQTDCCEAMDSPRLCFLDSLYLKWIRRRTPLA